MGKQIVVICDSCGKDVYGKDYVTLAPRKFNKGKCLRFGTIWLCNDCFRKTKLQDLLFNDNEEKNDTIK